LVCINLILFQLALFDVAENHLLTLADVDEQTKNLLYRMTANAYFSTYDYIYDKYVSEFILLLGAVHLCSVKHNWKYLLNAFARLDLDRN